MAGLGGKFWAASDDDTEEESTTEESSVEGSSDGSSSDSDSDSDSSAAGKRNKFLAALSDEDSDEDRGPVKSAKDRRYEELRRVCDEIHNKMKINDWASIQSVFDKLNKQLEKTLKVLDDKTPPKMYVRILVELEDYLQEAWADRDARKKMNATNANALKIMRHRLPKHNKDYEGVMEAWRKNPVESEDESESESESDSDEESPSEEDSDSDVFEQGRKEKKDKIMDMDPKDVTYEMVANKLKEILQVRGKRGTDRQEAVEMLQYLATVARGAAQRVSVYSQLISCLFDLNPSMSTHMKVPQWKKCVHYFFKMVEILKQNPNIKVEDDLEAVHDRTEEPGEDEEVKVWCALVATAERLDDELFKSLQVIDPHTHEYLERLKDEPYFLALAHKVLEWLEQKQDLENLPKMALRLIEHYYYKTEAVYGAMRNLAIQRQAEAPEEPAEPEEGDKEDEEAEEEEEEDGEEGDAAGADDTVDLRIPSDFVMEEFAHRAVDTLVKIVFKHGDERTKARAMMCSIFHKCIQDEFYTARDWFLMSHLQENVQLMDISTQILYNRMIAQMGLCAFRNGLIAEAQGCLSELYASGRIKELLAQGMTMSRYQEKTAEQEKLERMRQMPFHMHINLELLESIHLISAMLLEVPHLAGSPLGGSNRRMISKPFSWLLDNYQNHTYSGPPENVKDHVVAATKAMLRGDWRKSYQFVSGLNCWGLLPNKQEVLDMLQQKLKEESLRTYFFAYAAQYSSLSLTQLCDMFDLPKETVHSIVSRMIISDEVHGAWDHPTSTVVMRNIQATKLQTSALQFADKVSLLLEINERSLRQIRTGSMYDDEQDGRRRGQWDDDGGRHRPKGGGGNSGGILGMVRNAGAGQRGKGRNRGKGYDRGSDGGFGGKGNYRGNRRDDNQSSMSLLGSVRGQRGDNRRN